MGMHPGQVDLDIATVRAALRERCPGVGERSIEPVTSHGTVVALFRLGDDLVARFPLVTTLVERVVAAECDHAREVAPHLPVPIPAPVAALEPGDAYPGWWSIWTWLDGTTLDRHPPHQPDVLARDLAVVIRAHHALPTRGRTWNGAGRGGRPLQDTEWVRRSIALGGHVVDPLLATSIWERALAAPPHEGEPVFIHGDLMPGNLLIREGRLAGVLDNGPGTFGDPASDLAPAWYLFDQPSTLLERMSPTDAQRERARGWAFEMAIGALHYYERTNRPFFEVARRTLDRLIADN